MFKPQESNFYGAKVKSAAIPQAMLLSLPDFVCACVCIPSTTALVPSFPTCHTKFDSMLCVIKHGATGHRVNSQVIPANDYSAADTWLRICLAGTGRAVRNWTSLAQFSPTRAALVIMALHWAINTLQSLE